MTAPSLAGMYFNQHWPLSLVNLLQDLVANQQSDPNSPSVPVLPVVRVWLSQPRVSTDPTTEVLTVQFKLPLSVGEFSIEILRVSCVFEVWYQDRNNNWIAMPDENYQPMKINVSTSQDVAWYKYHAYTYPIVAKAVQFRITRRPDPTLGNQPYQIALRQGLIRRNVYTRSSGTQAMEDEQDSMGNIISKYIDDWDAMGAIDDDPQSFWRSAPMPDPAAVVCHYSTWSNPDGTPQLMDGLVIDPVYINQQLNVYVSNDDTVGTTRLSPIALPPDTDENTDWVAGTGRSDISGDGTSIYQVPLALGPLVSRDCWMGVEWAPDFDPTLSSSVQFISISGTSLSGTFLLSLDGTQWTTALAFGASTTAVQSAVEALSVVGTGNVVVTGTPGAWTASFGGALAGEDIPTFLYNTTSLHGTGLVFTVHVVTEGGIGGGPANNPILLQVSPGMNAVQVISIEGVASGGHFQLGLDGTHFSSNLADDVDGPAMQTALEALTAIGTGNVVVVGDAGGPWSASFQNDLAQQAVANLQVVNALTGGPPDPSVQVRTTVTGAPPPNPGGDQYWPQLYYDVGAGEVILELTNGTTSKTWSTTLSPLLTQNAPLRIVVGWTYGADQNSVLVSVVRADGVVLGNTIAHPSDLPSQITLDGEVGYYDFRGNMTATVIKLEDWANGQAAFQANPAMYVNPNPVQPDPNTGIVPSTTLDNAVLAVDWTLQDMAYGGGHASMYENKSWTPVFANYVTQKGRLDFPQAMLVKYLKLEFYNLTEESYPVYDSGIQVLYQTFPLSVTMQATTKNKNMTSLGVVSTLLSWTNQPAAGGTQSVNWLNPSTVQAAVNSVFGQTTQPVTVQTGPGTLSTSLPNTDGSTAQGTTVEIGTPAVYRRQLPNTSVLASQQLKQIASSAVKGITSQFTPLVSFSPSSTALPLQGSDWWIVPGQTAVLAANVMSGLTGSTSVVTSRKTTTQYRLRFTTTGVHQYQTKVAVRDAAMAYFAGIRDLTAFKISYIDNQDPASFVFSPFDANQWVFNNVKQLDSGPITTQGTVYQIQNPLFDTTLDNWTQVAGDWSIDPAAGRTQFGAAKVTADGTVKALESIDITAWPGVTPGANFEITAWVQYSGATSSGSGSAQLVPVYYQGDTLLSRGTPAAISATGTSLWAGAGGQQITLDGTVPADCDTIHLSLELTTHATAGDFWFDTVLIDSTDTVEATTFIDIITQSTFVKVDCKFSDSGLVRSDGMWAALDPLDTNISQTQLAWYVDTIPDQVPTGSWGDTLAKWSDPVITWGNQFSEVAINIDPNMTFDGKRVLHFTRAAGAEEAGLVIRQITGFVPSGMFRLGVVYYKTRATTNQITLRLRRVSDGVYIYEESITPTTGKFTVYQTSFQELPDSPDQIYALEMVLTGDDADDIYINNLYTDIAQIRYFIRLGGESEFLHDVTQLAYTDQAIVSTTLPVNEVSIQSTILSPTAYQYSAVLTPNYLK